MASTLALLLLDEKEKNKIGTKDRKCWIRPSFTNRELFGRYHPIFQELKKDEKALKEFLRVDESQFEFLVEKLSCSIAKEDTQMRECIRPREIVCLTLRYLASSESVRSLEFQFRIERKTISRIIIEVCKTIFAILEPDFPKTTRKKEEGQ